MLHGGSAVSVSGRFGPSRKRAVESLVSMLSFLWDFVHQAVGRV